MNERITWPARTAAWVNQNAEALLIGMAVAAALVLVMLVLRSVGRRIKRSDPECRSWRSVIGHVLAKTSLIFMVVTALDTVSGYVEPPRLIGHTVEVLFIIALALQTAVWVRELALGAIGQVAGDEDENGISNARAVIRVLISVAVFALALIVILDNLGVNVTGLVAGLGIGGIAIGLAAQGVFSDLFAALSILFDKPFRRGDTIRYDNSVGTVERIGLKTTRLRAISGEQLIMANTKLLEREIHNLAAGHSRRATITFGLVYRTDPDVLATISDIARTAVDARTGCTFVRCSLVAFGPSSLDHELVYDSGSLDPNVNADDRASIMMRLLRDFAARGIEFAYPTQTTFTAAPDGTLVMPYAEPGEALMPIASLEEIRARIGSEVGVSSWLLIDQARIDAFADVTEDRQFIHIDAAAAAQTPFGGTIAHGFLSLSLLSRMGAEAMLLPDNLKVVVNYGLEHVRFLAPVPSGSRVRGRFTLDSVEEKAPGQFLMRHSVTVEIEGQEKPALAAVWLGLVII